MLASQNCNYFSPPIFYKLGVRAAKCELTEGRCTAYEDNKWCPEETAGLEDDIAIQQMLRYVEEIADAEEINV